MDINSITEEQQASAAIIQACYQALSIKPSNLVQELLADEATIIEWQHYPKGDVKDKITPGQYFYHSHSSHSPDRLPDHGHFHCFVRLEKISKAYQPLIRSENNKKNPAKDNLCHLFAIAVNHYGLPTALFTTNHWVVHGLWFNAEITSELLDHFVINNNHPSPHTNQWITAMAKLFKPQIRALLAHRDHVIAEWQEKHPTTNNVFTDKRLEVTSIFQLAD